MAPRTTSAVLLATALLLGSAGVAGATTGAAGTGSPAAVQYQPETTGQTPVTPPVDTPPADTPPVVTTTAPSASAPVTPVTPTKHTHEVPSKSSPTSTTPASTADAVTPAADVQPSAAADSPSSLPFTGFDVLPIALGGLLLLGLGLVVRLRARDGRS
jgi:cytoskeletal protein RodZ